jgi:hypothetical protein
LDEEARAALVSARAADLLGFYDAVVHSDADELVMADPARHRNLAAFAGSVGAAVVTAAGLDLQHLPRTEAPLDPSRSIGAQREWVRFSAAMCKPAFVRQKVRWVPGFHACEAPMVMAGLFLIHLRYADLPLGLRRLARTRVQPFASPELNLHQRVSDREFAEMVETIALLPKQEFDFDTTAPPLSYWVEDVRRRRSAGEPWLTVAGDRLWRLPERVRQLF